VVEMDVDKMEAGRELDKLVGVTFGFEPRVTWHVLDPTGKGSAFTADTERGVREWFSDILRSYPDSWVKDYHVGTWERWPRFSEDIGAAFEVVEKLRAAGYGVVIADTCGHAPWVADFDNGRDVTVEHESLPLAICRAALLAVSQETTPAEHSEAQD
jgi:hypothetical protein